MMFFRKTWILALGQYLWVLEPLRIFQPQCLAGQMLENVKTVETAKSVNPVKKQFA